MGAHVWWPKFLADNWFPKFRLSGWAPDWYAGFPVGQYYFPVPALMIWVLNVVMPYNVAFKLVTVSGPLMLPAAAYSFAKGMKAPWPAPPAFAIAAFGTLVQTRNDWQIYGGNIASTLAGEFSFTIGLAFALFGLGALAYTLDTGKRRWLPAVLIAAGDHVAHRRRDLHRHRGAPAVAHAPPAAHVGDRDPGRARRRRCSPRSGSLPLLVAADVHAEHAVHEAAPEGELQAAVVDAAARAGAAHDQRDRGTRSCARRSTRRESGQALLADAVAAVVDLAARRRRDRRRGLVPPAFDARAARARARHRRHVHRVARARDLEHAVPAVLDALVGVPRRDGRDRDAPLVAMLATRAYRWIRDGDLQDARARAWAEIATATTTRDIDPEVRKDAAWVLADRASIAGPTDWEPPERLSTRRRRAGRSRVGAIALAVVVRARRASSRCRGVERAQRQPGDRDRGLGAVELLGLRAARRRTRSTTRS